jgi:hypothetical protein
MTTTILSGAKPGEVGLSEAPETMLMRGPATVEIEFVVFDSLCAVVWVDTVVRFPVCTSLEDEVDVAVEVDVRVRV